MHTNERKSVHNRLGTRTKSRYDDDSDEENDRRNSRNNRENDRRNDQNDRRKDQRDYDQNDHVLDRDELESRRPQVKPWEINPEYVPKNKYYFEHDNREDFQPNFRGGRGNFRGRFDRGRGRGRGRGRDRNNYNFTKRSRSDWSPDWKHDKFQDLQNDEEMDEN